MGEWKSCTLSSLGTIVGGATPSTKKPENYEGGTIPWITPKDLSGFSGRYISHGERNITEKGLNSCSAQMMPKHSVLFSSRAPIGYVAISDCEVCTNQGFKSIVPNENTDYLFLYYLLQYKKKDIENLGSGTTFKEVSANTMKNVEVRVPAEKSEQIRIARVLSAIDDKIEANTRINENLQKQANLIFDELVGQHIPTMNDSNCSLQLHEIGNLDVLITDYVANGSFKSLADNVQYLSKETDNVLIRLTDYNNNFSSDMVYISDESYNFLSKSKLYGDEIIISNVGANVGTVFRCPRLNKRMSLAPNAIMLRSAKYEHYLYLYFISHYGQQQLQSIVTGSAQPKFNKTNFRSLKVVLPDETILNKITDMYNPMFEQIVANLRENKVLVEIRDSLLPKLMSGELEVSGFQF